MSPNKLNIGMELLLGDENLFGMIRKMDRGVISHLPNLYTIHIIFKQSPNNLYVDWGRNDAMKRLRSDLYE